MAAKSKIELLLELKNRIKTGISKAKDQLSKGTREMKDRLSDLKQHHVQAFSAMKDEIPGFARAVDLIKNPYVLATAAVISFMAISNKAVAEASKFESAFLNVKQLNLDKSKQELSEYNQLIRNTAFDVGTDLVKTTNAFYDIQSATGLYGQSAAKFFKQVGDFSIATGADLNETTNAATKAMKAFGFGVDEVGSYLESNAKTVQLGITTFKELAQVQTEYAGAAASANQTVDTANKLFAVFTATSKDSQTAATKTKTAFQGLTAKSTIDGFKKVGVNMFDANGALLKTEDIITQLVPKIKGMSDLKFSTFKNEIGGPEGLQDLLSALRSDGDGVLKTFKDFDNVQFNINDALKNAKGDVNVLKDIVGNQLNIVLAEMGQVFLPMIAKGLNAFGNVLGFVRDHADTFLAVMKSLVIVYGFYLAGVGLASLSTVGFTGAVGALSIGFHALKTAILSVPLIGWILAAVAVFVTLYKESEQFRAVIDGVIAVVSDFINLLRPIPDLIAGLWDWDTAKISKAWGQLKDNFSNFSVTASFKQGYNDSLEASKQAKEDRQAAFNINTEDGTGSGDSSGVNSQVNGAGVVGDAARIRNISVNIEAWHKGDNIIHSEKVASGSMTLEEFERMMNEIGLRNMRNIETSAG